MVVAVKIEVQVQELLVMFLLFPHHRELQVVGLLLLVMAALQAEAVEEPAVKLVVTEPTENIMVQVVTEQLVVFLVRQ